MHKAKLRISRPQYGDNRRKIAIAVKDADAGVEFLSLEIDLADFAECLTGAYETECEMEVRGLEYVGKKVERRTIEFETLGNDRYCRKDLAQEAAKEHTPDGWVCDNYFGSQNSFFRKDDKEWARTTIKRWVDKDSD